MNANDLVSIIVPVYGVESYLPECVDSLLAQTYKNIQIILVDDASPDRCGEICDAYAAADSRVKVIHKKNGGAASARNAGIDAVTGDYVCFVDSDDVVAPEYVQRLYEKLLSTQADVAVCGFTIFTKAANDQQAMEPCGVYGGNEYLALFLRNWTCSLIWNKIYRRNIIGDTRFAEGHRIDDEFFTYRLVLDSKRIVVFEDVLYHYRQRCSSVMKSDEGYHEQMFLDKIEYLTERWRTISVVEPQMADAFLKDLLDSFVRFWRQSANMPSVSDAIRKWVRENIRFVIKAKVGWKFKCVIIYELLMSRPGVQTDRDIPLGDTDTFFD